MTVLWLLCVAVVFVEAAPPLSHHSFAIKKGAMSPGSPDEIETRVMVNTVSGEQVTILVGSGGRTEELRLLSKRHAGKLHDVLQTHEGNATAVRANLHWAGCPLLPFANRIANGAYHFQGASYQLPLNENVPGVRTDALHGFLCNRSLTVLGEWTFESEARLRLGYNFSGTDTPGFPWPLHVTIDFVLTAFDGFVITTRAFNPSTTGQALPWYNSWHPYFKVADVSRAIIELDKCSDWNHVVMPPGAPRKGSLIPTGQTQPINQTKYSGKVRIGGSSDKPTYLDDEFKATASVHDCPRLANLIIDPVVGEAVALWGDPQYRVFQIFTGGREVFPEHWSAVAMEPMSALANGYNNHDGVTVLSAQQTFEGSFGVHMA